MSQGEESSTNILRGGGKSARGRKFAIKLGNVNQGMSEVRKLSSLVVF